MSRSMGTEAVSDPVGKAQRQVDRKVLGMKGVAGTAQGMSRGKPCIKVYLEKDDPGLRAKVPRKVGGVPVEVEVTGRMRRL